ncbi:BTAD domain-containing putative transcriptional regulator [Amycolatopsis granulosa]|uniref:BTAD domain-containing putative transcriptional regulator n=1 Tax=Amycolatopsis granulosa TaxID=185684 RepID=UPI0014221A10|nr:DNA-binding SARP family transcriptional activator [Amycolatopsis granulosa]
MREGLRVRLLGPVELSAGGRAVPVGGAGVRGLLAILALAPNRTVALDDLIDALWRDPPPTARTIVHGNVSQLRRVLRSLGTSQARIETAPPGYRLRIDPSLIDVHQARALSERAEAAPLSERARLLAEAWALWRGPELGGVPESLRAPQLADLRRAVHGARVDADLALGRHEELITELTPLVRQDPRRERTAGQLMRALYHSGRRAEALEVYREVARYASRTLGLDPGPDLRALHQHVLHDDLAPAAAAVDVRRVVPRQLPPAVAVLAGRSADLAWLDGLDTIGVLTGPPGIGKSALAVTWAHRVSARFPDGVLFAPLHGFDAAHAPMPVTAVLAQFLLGLGVPPPGLPQSEDERLALYRSLTGERRMLVVLDDARSADQVRPLLPPGPGSLAVVTSRARLDGLTVSHGARVRPLAPLARDDSVRLIGEVAGEAAAGHHEQLARLCGDLPLALRIAGARLAAAPAWAVPEFVAELASERTRLDALDVDDAGVRAALDVSYRGLPDDVAALFRALAAFPGPTVGPFPAAALGDVPVGEARRRLRVLAAHHLLAESGPDVFTQHDLVRLYQRELGGASPAALARVVRYYQAAADRARRCLLRIVDPLEFSAGPLPEPAGFDDALAWFAAEWPNLLAVLEAAAQAGLHGDVWRLARVVHTYRVVRPLWDEWQQLVALGMSAAEACGDAEARFWMLISRCALSLTFGPGAQSLADASAAAALAGADFRRRICAMIHLGSALGSCGRHEEAVACLGEAIEAAARAGADELRGQALANCAEVEKARGRFARAIEHQLASLEIDRRLGDDSYVVVSLNNLAESYLGLGDDERAMSYASDAVELAARRGFQLQESVGRFTVGRLLRRRGDLEGARRQVELAAELHERVSPTPSAEMRAELAALASAGG